MSRSRNAATAGVSPKSLGQSVERTGQAFPVIASFDPFSDFSYRYYAFGRRVDITVRQGLPWEFSTPAPDSSVNAVVAYNSLWAAHYAPDSTGTALHILIEPTPRVQGGLYPSEVLEDSKLELPAHVEWRGAGGDDEVLSFDYQSLLGHWVLVHAKCSNTQHALGMNFKVIADVTFSDIAFPAEAPDPRLSGTPLPASTVTPR